MITNFISGLQEFHFLQNALITSVVIGIIAGTIGSFIILRGMSLMGDAISHAVLPGVAISFMFGIHPLIGAAIFGIVASFLITLIRQNSVIKSDTAIGITFSTFLALGVILIALVPTTTNLFHILFGNVLAVQDQDMYLTIGVSVVVLILVGLFFKELLLTSFDPTMAKALGMRVNAYHYLLMAMLTLVSVVSMQSVGTILIVSLLVTPAATAYLFCNKLKSMIIVSATLGGVTSVLGLFIGYNLNIAVGSCIVIVGAIIFAISFIFSPKQTLIHRRRLSNETEIDS
ncbi:manganese ABC transporter substrate-binding protein [Lentilactobacillus curieae]|uniref:Manganese import system permease protein ScaB n=1 Tax=Lentilactobacillus curieae TaxID=1138822 RepID=A0A1S6QHG6_9LACO|nr:metal ABC transporter permease [Lentilactobacillus curieae]AQW21045.1 manganese ABC transporter substrate-binding protein [Lentilactobacillus curieae]